MPDYLEQAPKWNNSEFQEKLTLIDSLLDDGYQGYETIKRATDILLLGHEATFINWFCESQLGQKIDIKGDLPEIREDDADRQKKIFYLGMAIALNCPNYLNYIQIAEDAGRQGATSRDVGAIQAKSMVASIYQQILEDSFIRSINAHDLSEQYSHTTGSSLSALDEAPIARDIALDIYNYSNSGLFGTPNYKRIEDILDKDKRQFQLDSLRLLINNAFKRPLFYWQDDQDNMRRRINRVKDTFSANLGINEGLFEEHRQWIITNVAIVLSTPFRETMMMNTTGQINPESAYNDALKVLNAIVSEKGYLPETNHIPLLHYMRELLKN